MTGAHLWKAAGGLESGPWVGQLSCVHDLVKFFRANPQALALLIVCLVLGLGTFLVVVFGLVASGSTTTSGYPDGFISVLHALAPY